MFDLKGRVEGENLTQLWNIPQDVQKGCRRGRSERRGESYSVPYGESLSDARTKPTGFFNILLKRRMP